MVSASPQKVVDQKVTLAHFPMWTKKALTILRLLNNAKGNNTRNPTRPQNVDALRHVTRKVAHDGKAARLRNEDSQWCVGVGESL